MSLYDHNRGGARGPALFVSHIGPLPTSKPTPTDNPSPATLEEAKARIATLEDQLRQANADAEAADQAAMNMHRKCKGYRSEIASFRQQLTAMSGALQEYRNAARADDVPWNGILKLCHPDAHDGSPARLPLAHEITKYLLRRR